MSDEEKDLNQNKNEGRKNVGLKPNLYLSLVFKFLKLFLLLLSIVYILFLYDKTTNQSEITYKIWDFFTKNANYDIRIKTDDNNYIIIPFGTHGYNDTTKFNRSYKKNIINDVLKKYNSKNEYDIFNKSIIFVNTVEWKYKKVIPNNIYFNPIGIRINDDEVFIYENGKQPEIYNHKIKKFKLLPFEGDLGDLYYKNKSGEILFLNYDNITIFDLNTKQFKKVSEGISELKESQYKHFILPYSDEYIYIFNLKETGGYQTKSFCYLDSVIKLNLNTYEYSSEKISDSPLVTSYGIINNDKILLLTDSSDDIYFYDVNTGAIEKNGSIKDIGDFYIFQYDTNKLLLLPQSPNTFFQTINLDDMNTELLYILLDKVYYSSPILNNKNIIFQNGIIFDTEKQKLYYPNKYKKIQEDYYNNLIISLNDKEFLRLGCKYKGGRRCEMKENVIKCNNAGSGLCEKKGSIISIEEFNDKELYMLNDSKHSYVIGKYILLKRRK